jgi:hypothetical protein
MLEGAMPTDSSWSSYCDIARCFPYVEVLLLSYGIPNVPSIGHNVIEFAIQF